jgi:prepilin-type N-terminal cleavage/methylation domain-containing protein
VVASRKAFTLIELLIVILILAVLAGLVIIGLGVLSKPNQEKVTKQTLQNLRSTLDELRNKTNLANFYPQNDSNWHRPVAAPTGTLADKGKNPSSWTTDQVRVIGNTRVLMHKIRQVPTNKTALDDLPAERQFKFGGLPGRNEDVTIHDSPVLLDAWGVPIICVPAEGLSGVRQAGQPYTITTVKRRASGEDATVLLPGARPFFVSAGPDGDFSTGDDNIYSFED